MKKKNLIVLLGAVLGMTLAGCNKKKNPEPPVEPEIQHQAAFVSSVENPSMTRAFRGDFDQMIEDFSGATPTGTKNDGATFNKAMLRVLVDSEDAGEPLTPDAAIYKMATGNYEIENFEGIGFKMRIVGNATLKLSNLVLGLRGDDAFKVFPIKLSEAKDPDGEALPELTGEFQDIIVAPGLSIEDANTLYELAAGGNSETKVLDKILGFHLYALEEECSAIVEIQEVFLMNAGEKTSLDVFDRANVGQADPTCWWRGSTGFIVQSGVTLKNGTYTTGDVTLGDFENLVINISGDASGLKINNVAYSALKDNENTALTAAVNGGFYSYVINLANSSLALSSSKFAFESTTEVVISQIFLTNLQNELPASEYPHIDIANASYVSKFEFTIAKGTVKTNYDDAVLDTRVTDQGLNYMISYNNGSEIEIDGHDLVISGGDYDYANLVIGSNANASAKYLVLAIKAEAKPSGLRLQLGSTASEIWLNDMVADAGLPSWSEEANYPYVTQDGYRLVIINLARNGQEGGNNEVTLWYTGAEDIKIGSIFFANDYRGGASIKETTLIEQTVAAADPEDYAYVGGADLAGDAKYVHIETNAAVANQIRFEGANGAKWLKDGQIKDIDGNVVADGSEDYIIDLVASELINAGTGTSFHIHSTAGATAFNIKASLYEVIPSYQEITSLVRDVEVEAGAGEYAYVTGYDVPADLQYIKVETDAAVANQLRFEGTDGAKWLKDGAIIDLNGEPVADGSTEYVIDLIASGLKVAGEASALHVHSTNGATAFNVKLYTFEMAPLQYAHEIAVMVEATVPANDGAYAYVGGYDLPANALYVKVETNAAVANQIRFEGPNGAKWLKDGAIKDADGNTVADGSAEYVIDLAASELINPGTASAFHVHSTAGATAFTIRVTLVELIEVGSYADLMVHYVG